jgi:hypothetical protein
MKTSTTLLSVSVLVLAGAQGVLAAPADPVVVERGPHHRVIQRTLTERRPDGTTAERQSSYTELATGLHYQNERGEWLESREEIEIFQGAAVARQGQHSVIFAANLNSVGAIDLLDPSGQRFRSHVIGLAYTDAASGRSVMIAEVKDCPGAVLPPNQVIYQDAFAGDCLADVRYTYTLGAFEQDVILLTAPPPPETYGLAPESSRLEVWTEFVELPEGTATSVVLKQESDTAARARMAEPDLIDQRLDFRVMKMEQGRAFPLGQDDPFSGEGVLTGKSMERIDGRVFLIEKVNYRDVREHLELLPKQAAAARPTTPPGRALLPRRPDLPGGEPAHAASPPAPELRAARSGQSLGVAAATPYRVDERTNSANARTLLARAWSAPKGERGAWKDKQYASLDARRRGFVLDYVTLNSSLTNYVFKGDTTYHPTAVVNLYGTTILEGGAVIKGGGVTLRGPVDCRTAPYRRATWTHKDDDSIGEIITGSIGAPTNYAGTLLNLYDTSAAYDLHDFRLLYGQYGIIANAGVKADLSHFQIGKGQYGVGLIATAVANCRNFLFYDVSLRAFPITGTVTNRSEHGTFHRISHLRQTTNSGPFGFTNCLLISVTNNLDYTGLNNVFSLDDTGFFQTVGAGSHYLAGGSTNRNAGTTNINPTLLADLKQRTTYPPIVLTNHITNDTTLTAQAQRDTDTPDLGYLYDPLDYVASQIAVTNATLTLQTGTALGVHGSSTAPGLVLLNGGKVLSTGAPDNLNRLVRYNLVQEQATTNWSASSVGRTLTTVAPYGTNLLTTEARFRLTDFSMPANGNDHLYAGATNLTFTVQDCQFHGGKLTAIEPDVTLLNNLFNRVSLTLSANKNPFTALVRNCTLAGGSLWASNAVGCAWTFTDNLFDTTNLVQSGAITHNYNAYLTNAVRLTPNGANDVLLTVTNTAYDTGWLGRFYLPTNLTSHSPLFNSGSQNATNAGLYHFTTTTNQVKETNSVVDIGFHAVALSTQPSTLNQPVDTDADGSADYLEDANGNGSVDSGETDWQTYNSPNGLTGSPGLQVFTPLK